MTTVIMAFRTITRPGVRLFGGPPALFRIKCWIKLILLCVTAAPTLLAQSLAPIAYYPLNGTAQDASGSGLHGTIVGAVPSADRFGNTAGALLFANDLDRVDCGNPPAFNFTSAFTISAWINLSGTRENSYVVSKYEFDFNSWSGSPNSYGLGLAGVPYPYTFIGDDTGYQDVIGWNAPLSVGQWHAVSMVYDGAYLNLYANGALVGSRYTGPFPAFVNSIPLTIGGTFSDQVFGGSIDDVRIYNRALSPEEITAQYQADLPVPPPTSASLVAYYPLNGNGQDKSGHNLHGTLVGTMPIPDRFGKKNRALLFNGSDRVNCGNPAEFNFTGNFTLSAWVKMTGEQFNQYVVAKYDFNPETGASSPFSYGMGIDGNSDPYGFVGADLGYQDILGIVPLSDHDWHAISFVYDSGLALRLYLDGALIRSRPIGVMQPFINSVPLTIGGTAVANGFVGGIDEVRIHNKALSAEEILTQYQADTPKASVVGLKAGLVGYYPLNVNARDKSGNNFHGTLYGTTPTTDRFGNSSGALFFNGSTDRIVCGNPAAFNFTNNFTLNAWVKVNGAQFNEYVVAKFNFDVNTWTGSPNSYGLGINGNTDPYGFVGGNSGYTDLMGGVNLNDGQWHFLSMVYHCSQQTLRLYLDSNLLGARLAGALPPFVNSVPLTIGGAFSGQAFGGAIDDVRIYNRALSEEEITLLFTR
jgi:hypothetical protein